MTAVLNGLLLIDKPVGPTSHDVVDRIRRILGLSAVGHTGTLDPLASGLMVMLIGEGTKISEYILTGDKGYEASLRLGLVTDTWDITGQVVREASTTELDPEVLAAEALKLVGEREFPVPVYSAVKKSGKKLYEYAREGKAVEIPRRVMSFYDVQLRSVSREEIQVSLRCSKGGFVRSWAHVLGENLKVGAVLSSLRRTFSAPYSLENAVTLDRLETAVREIEVGADPAALLGGAFIPLAECLPEWKALTISGRDERLLTHGQIPHDLSRRLIFEQKLANREERTVGIRVLSAQHGQLLSLLEAQPYKGLKIRRIFNVHT